MKFKYMKIIRNFFKIKIINKYIEEKRMKKFF